MACPLHTRVAAGPTTTSICPGVHFHRRAVNGRGTALDALGRSSGTSTAISSGKVTASTEAIKVNITPKPSSPPPRPPPTIHSPVYVQKALIKTGGDGAPVPTPVAKRRDEEEEQETRDKNSLLWALKQVDRSLDELETNPLPLQKELYQLSVSPVGTATSSALATAAKVTVAATKEAVRAAVPVGKWMLTEGSKAAMAFISRAMAEGAQQKGGTTKVKVGKGNKE